MKIEEMIKQLKRGVSLINEFKEPLDEAGGGYGISITGNDAQFLIDKLNELQKSDNKALHIADVIAILPSDSKMKELIRSRSQLYTSYSVKDKEDKYKGVVDIESVVGLLREVLGN